MAIELASLLACSLREVGTRDLDKNEWKYLWL